MPSFSAAISLIGRISASCAISILDFGFLCWSSPRATPLLPNWILGPVLALSAAWAQPSGPQANFADQAGSDEWLGGAGVSANRLALGPDMIGIGRLTRAPKTLQ